MVYFCGSSDTTTVGIWQIRVKGNLKREPEAGIKTRNRELEPESVKGIRNRSHKQGPGINSKNSWNQKDKSRGGFKKNNLEQESEFVSTNVVAETKGTTEKRGIKKLKIYS